VSEVLPMINKYKESFENCAQWHPIGNRIKWRYLRHWGQNFHAGEGDLGRKNGAGKYVDGSGGLSHITGTLTTCTGNKVSTEGMFCSKPIVFLQREYVRGKEKISAVLSYPNGLSILDTYFWETYPAINGDIERFTDERKMESYIKKCFTQWSKKKRTSK